MKKNENDTWAIEVNKRILGCIDFVASEARYHRDSRARFSGGKNLLPQNQMYAKIAMKKCYIILDTHVKG